MDVCRGERRGQHVVEGCRGERRGEQEIKTDGGGDHMSWMYVVGNVVGNKSSRQTEVVTICRGGMSWGTSWDACRGRMSWGTSWGTGGEDGLRLWKLWKGVVGYSTVLEYLLCSNSGVQSKYGLKIVVYISIHSYHMTIPK